MAAARLGMSYDQLREELEHSRFSPVYLFHGEEDFLIEEAVDALIGSALKGADKGFNLDILYGGDLDARTVISYASTFPMNAERRVVVVREVEKLSEGELLSLYAEKPSATTSMILVSTKPDFRKRPYNVLKTSSTVVEFRKLYENQIPAWIELRVGAFGHQITPDASRLLAEYIGNSLREIQNELEKLFVFMGDRKEITAEDVKTVCGISKEFSIFELQNAMGACDAARSLEILNRMLDAGESAVKIIAMLSYYYISLRKLLDLRRRGATQQEQAASLGIKPFFLTEFQQALSHYDETKLDNALLELTRTDELLKTSSSDPRQLLQFMTIGILRQESLWEASLPACL